MSDLPLPTPKAHVSDEKGSACWCGDVHVGPICKCNHDELVHLVQLGGAALGKCHVDGCFCPKYDRAPECYLCQHVMVFEVCGWATVTRRGKSQPVCHADDHSCYMEIV